MAMMGFVLARPWAYRLGGALMRRIVPLLPRALVYGPGIPGDCSASCRRCPRKLPRSDAQGAGMSSRDTILADLRQAAPPAAVLCPSRRRRSTYSDPARQFAEMLASVGGKAIHVPSARISTPNFEKLEVYAAGEKDRGAGPWGERRQRRSREHRGPAPTGRDRRRCASG